jgi:hypothetical protein
MSDIPPPMKIPFLAPVSSAIFRRMDKYSHHVAALDSLRQVNKELIVCSMSNVSDRVEARCIAARRHILAAIHELAPAADHASRPFEERPLDEQQADIADRLEKFAPITAQILENLETNESSKN